MRCIERGTVVSTFRGFFVLIFRKKPYLKTIIDWGKLMSDKIGMVKGKKKRQQQYLEYKSFNDKEAREWRKKVLYYT